LADTNAAPRKTNAKKREQPMLIIRHRAGPLAGKEQQIEGQSGRVTFGRDPAVCDVVYPPDLTIVARRHFALVQKPSGEWTFDLFGDPYVSVDGQPAEVAASIHAGSVIELGRRGGPSFEVIDAGKSLSDVLPATEKQQKVVGSHAAAARARRLSMAGIALAVIAAGAAGTFWYLQRDAGARLETAVAALSDQQAKAAADSIGAPVRDRLLEAAYLVVVQFASGEVRASGTASPIAPDLLATNAHVAAIGDTLGPQDKMFVRSPGPNGKLIEVIERKKHPGYDAFNTFLRQDPIFVPLSKNCPTCLPNVLQGSLSYDVATLRVAPGSNLGPVLQIASREELNAMHPGTPLALAGYPLENIQGSEVQALGATPNLRIGMITAMTDMFNLPADVAVRRLIHHNIPVTGGNSGSPMLGASGKLVALLNSGNVLAREGGGRMPNAAIVNYAQRVDMLDDLVNNRADGMLAAEREYWAKQTAAFRRGIEVIVPRLLVELKPSKEMTETLVNETKASLVKTDAFSGTKDGKPAPRRQKIHSVTLKAGQPGVFIAYAQERAAIELYIVVDGKIVAKDDRGVWFPAITFKMENETKADIYVVGPDGDVDYTLMQYAWNPPPS
jgi:hypothetical protein